MRDVEIHKRGSARAGGSTAWCVLCATGRGVRTAVSKKSAGTTGVRFSTVFCKTPFCIPNYHIFRVMDELRN